MMPNIQKGITNYYFGEGRLHPENSTELLHLIFFWSSQLLSYILILSYSFPRFFKLSTVQLEQMDTAHNSVNNGE